MRLLWPFRGSWAQEPRAKAKYVYTDGSKEFEKAARDLQWLHDDSNPYRPETNGVAERAVRRAKEGTSATLVQSGKRLCAAIAS